MNHKRKNLSEMSFGSEDDSNQVKEPNNLSQSFHRAVDMTATTNGSSETTEQQLSQNLSLFRMNMQ